jgi:Tfp pilus assembly protein PilO
MAFGLDDPDKKRAVLIGLLLMGLGYVFYQYLWKPVHEERVVLEERRSTLERYNDQARALTQPRRLNDLKRQEAEYQVALAAYETMLPSESEVAGLLADVAIGAAQNGIAIVNFAPLEAVAGENLMELPYDVQVQGGYHDIGRFMSEIANLPRLVRPVVTAMEQVQIQEQGAAQQGAAGTPAPSGPQAQPQMRYEVLVTIRLSTFMPIDQVELVEDDSEASGPVPSTSASNARGSDAS